MTLIDPSFRFKFECPNCGCLFGGKTLISTNTFGYSFYSDGRLQLGSSYTTSRGYAYQCPCCRIYFLGHDANWLSFDKLSSDDLIKNILDHHGEIGKTENDVGCLGLEMMLKNGFYHPTTESNEETTQKLIDLYLQVWRYYNYELSISSYIGIEKNYDFSGIERYDDFYRICKLANIDDEMIKWHYNYRIELLSKYNDLCNKILTLFDPISDYDMITYAEINRNIGNFDVCIEYLDKVKDKVKCKNMITQIKAACKVGIKHTIIIKE